ncbi:hypothetical protein IV38_GL001677 [Lactobacillus selangorensis]|uniref:Uncharacterized protein n=1 Tax=Lactobacillus selangorensis TaxID=81857 RepID=A0A0R2FHW0_9LACO|nr:hypothetical protein [Lactobacillus selangorensis]KRN28223.1 hypothetical protein IV38_GL001677 [Lactobacillus selangorensis]KRN30901.1 hypothetical protein IV40_GL001538 [Lactobacillus selangorensis]
MKKGLLIGGALFSIGLAGVTFQQPHHPQVVQAAAKQTSYLPYRIYQYSKPKGLAKVVGAYTIRTKTEQLWLNIKQNGQYTLFTQVSGTLPSDTDQAKTYFDAQNQYRTTTTPVQSSLSTGVVEKKFGRFVLADLNQLDNLLLPDQTGKLVLTTSYTTQANIRSFDSNSNVNYIDAHTMHTPNINYEQAYKKMPQIAADGTRLTFIGLNTPDSTTAKGTLTKVKTVPSKVKKSIYQVAPQLKKKPHFTNLNQFFQYVVPGTTNIVADHYTAIDPAKLKGGYTENGKAVKVKYAFGEIEDTDDPANNTQIAYATDGKKIYVPVDQDRLVSDDGALDWRVATAQDFN